MRSLRAIAKALQRVGLAAEGRFYVPHGLLLTTRGGTVQEISTGAAL